MLHSNTFFYAPKTYKLDSRLHWNIGKDYSGSLITIIPLSYHMLMRYDNGMMVCRLMVIIDSLYLGLPISFPGRSGSDILSLFMMLRDEASTLA